MKASWRCLRLQRASLRRLQDKIIRDIRTLFEQKKQYYETKRVDNFWKNNDIEYESSGYKNIDLSLDEYLNKIEPYLGNMIINLQNFDTWKIQLTIAINFISSKDSDEERIMHLNSNSIKFTSYSDTNYIIKKLIQNTKRI